MQIKIKTPAKINLGLEVLSKRDDGFHNIASVMQTINLYDYLEFSFTPSEKLTIELSGDSKVIPYNENNLVYKAITLFYDTFPQIPFCNIKIVIRKHIPIQAGLGGGSSNAAGAIWALNKVFNMNLLQEKIDKLCACLGSDLNVCYHGGTCYAEARGEKVTQINSRYNSGVSVIKPINFGISAKDGYLMYDSLGLPDKEPSNVVKLKKALITGTDIVPYMYNDLEVAPIKKFDVLKRVKKTYPSSIMTGSGSAFFVLDNNINRLLPESEYQIIDGLEFTNCGVSEM